MPYALQRAVTKAGSRFAFYTVATVFVYFLFGSGSCVGFFERDDTDSRNFEFKFGEDSFLKSEESVKCNFGVLMCGEVFSRTIKFLASDGYKITVKDGETDCGCLTGKTKAHKDATEVEIDIEMSPVYSEQPIQRKLVSDIEIASTSKGTRHQLRMIVIIEFSVRNPISFRTDKLTMDFRSDAKGYRKDRWTFSALNYTGVKASEVEITSDFAGVISIHDTKQKSVLNIQAEANRPLVHGEIFSLSFGVRGDSGYSKEVGSVLLVAYDSGLTRVLPSTLVSIESEGLWELEFFVILPRKSNVDPESVEIALTLNDVKIDKDSVTISKSRERVYRVTLAGCKTPIKGALSGILTSKASSSEEPNAFRFEATCYHSEEDN